MITNLPSRLPEKLPPDYAYPIRLLLNVRRSIAQRYQTIKHIPTVTEKEIVNIIALYQLMYAMECQFRHKAQMPPLSGMPKWAEPEVGVVSEIELP